MVDVTIFLIISGVSVLLATVAGSVLGDRARYRDKCRWIEEVHAERLAEFRRQREEARLELEELEESILERWLANLEPVTPDYDEIPEVYRRGL